MVKVYSPPKSVLFIAFVLLLPSSSLISNSTEGCPLAPSQLPEITNVSSQYPEVALPTYSIKLALAIAVPPKSFKTAFVSDVLLPDLSIPDCHADAAGLSSISIRTLIVSPALAFFLLTILAPYLALIVVSIATSVELVGNVGNLTTGAVLSK